MRVFSLNLRNFRNYHQLDVDFSPNINVLVGDNAQGKTNILEAIYMSALGKSHRGNKDQELIMWDENFYKITSHIERNQHRYQIDLAYSQDNKKSLKVNAVTKNKLSTLMDYLNVVLFSPEDLELVKGGPALRRRFLDILISQISPKYFYSLQQYYKILNQRNAYLRDLKFNPQKDRNLLDLWDLQLSKNGGEIIGQRLRMVKKIEEKAEQHHQVLSNGRESLKVIYTTVDMKNDSFNSEDLELELYNKYEKGRNNDIKRGHTLIGPHRDDIKLIINDYEARIYASQGQQRSITLALKMAELQCIEDDTEEKPVLLLDDVMSELDEKRRTFLVQEIGDKIQTFITTTDLNFIKINRNQTQIYQVEKGSITN